MRGGFSNFAVFGRAIAQLMVMGTRQDIFSGPLSATKATHSPIQIWSLISLVPT